MVEAGRKAAGGVAAVATFAGLVDLGILGLGSYCTLLIYRIEGIPPMDTSNYEWVCLRSVERAEFHGIERARCIAFLLFCELFSDFHVLGCDCWHRLSSWLWSVPSLAHRLFNNGWETWPRNSTRVRFLTLLLMILTLLLVDTRKHRSVFACTNGHFFFV